MYSAHVVLAHLLAAVVQTRRTKKQADSEDESEFEQGPEAFNDVDQEEADLERGLQISANLARRLGQTGPP